MNKFTENKKKAEQESKLDINRIIKSKLFIEDDKIVGIDKLSEWISEYLKTQELDKLDNDKEVSTIKSLYLCEKVNPIHTKTKINSIENKDRVKSLLETYYIHQSDVYQKILNKF